MDVYLLMACITGVVLFAFLCKVWEGTPETPPHHYPARVINVGA